MKHSNVNWDQIKFPDASAVARFTNFGNLGPDGNAPDLYTVGSREGTWWELGICPFCEFNIMPVEQFTDINALWKHPFFDRGWAAEAIMCTHMLNRHECFAQYASAFLLVPQPNRFSELPNLGWFQTGIIKFEWVCKRYLVVDKEFCFRLKY